MASQRIPRLLLAGIGFALSLGGTSALALTSAELIPTGLPETLSGSYLAARSADTAHDLDAAVQYFETALENDPDNPQLIERLLVLKLASGRIDGAQALAERLLVVDAPNPVARLLVGVRLLKEGAVRQGKDRAHPDGAGAAGGAHRRPDGRLGRFRPRQDRRRAEGHRGAERAGMVRHLQGLSSRAHRRPRRPQGRGGGSDQQRLQDRRDGAQGRRGLCPHPGTRRADLRGDRGAPQFRAAEPSGDQSAARASSRPARRRLPSSRRRRRAPPRCSTGSARRSAPRTEPSCRRPISMPPIISTPAPTSR